MNRGGHAHSTPFKSTAIYTRPSLLQAQKPWTFRKLQALLGPPGSFFFTGQWYVTKEGVKYALSPSSGDTSHSIAGHCLGQHLKQCPATRSTETASADCPCRASFMAACCKLSYELEPVISDVVVNR